MELLIQMAMELFLSKLLGYCQSRCLQHGDAIFQNKLVNENIVVLIPKVLKADITEQYRPIALSNFIFKVITKFFAERLRTIMSNIISTNQKGFIKGRKIVDCICLTSEVINMLLNKVFGGNLAIRIDICKAFNTIDQNFLQKVMHSFGFDYKFYHWIYIILHFAKLSIYVNIVRLQVIFVCKRGVGQSDLFPPSLFTSCGWPRGTSGSLCQ